MLTEASREKGRKTENDDLQFFFDQAPGKGYDKIMTRQIGLFVRPTSCLTPTPSGRDPVSATC